MSDTLSNTMSDTLDNHSDMSNTIPTRANMSECRTGVTVMPCMSDHMMRSSREEESHRVANLISYVHRSRDTLPPLWVKSAAKEYYGDNGRLDDLTAMLCGLCRSMGADEQSKLIYDGRNAEARKLADWWDVHLESDRVRAEIEKIETNRLDLASRGRSKLTAAEREALGLD